MSTPKRTSIEELPRFSLRRLRARWAARDARNRSMGAVEPQPGAERVGDSMRLPDGTWVHPGPRSGSGGV